VSHWALVVLALVIIAAFVLVLVFALGVVAPRENKRR